MPKSIKDKHGNIYVQKKPLYKHVWFWIIIVLLALFIIGSTNSQNSSNNRHTSSTNRTSNSSSAKRKHKHSSYNIATVRSYAQAFGNKPVEKIQTMPSVYISQRVGSNAVYGWHPDKSPELVRVDDPNTNNTDVYIFDSHGQNNMLGKHLYTGRTIYQKQPKYVPMY